MKNLLLFRDLNAHCMCVHYTETVSKFGSGLFLLIQVILLLDFTHGWNASWVEKDEKFWYTSFLSLLKHYHREVWEVINLITCVLLQVCCLASRISILLCWCIHPRRISFPLVHGVWARLPIESVFHCSNSFPCLRFHNHLIAS